jgi:Na+-driven multidrug efflux pump
MKEKAFTLFLLALFLFFLPLALFPLSPLGPLGLPPVYLYLFGAWGLVLLLAYLLFRKP